MQSLRARILYRIVRYRMARLANRAPGLQDLRIERENSARRLFPAPADVAVKSVQIAGRTAEWLIPPETGGPGAVLHIHGGAYNTCSCVTHRALAARIAKAAKHPALIFDYRLAPENPFPAALEDAVHVCMAFSAEIGHAAFALAGDSAGGGLALALTMRLTAIGARTPTALALMSPWTDLAMTSATHQTKAYCDPFFPSPERLRLAARQYAGGYPLDHPLISPVYGSLAGLPPTLIHVGECETLINDSIWVAEGIKACGGSAASKVWPGMWHAWQMLARVMPEAVLSVRELGGFIASALAECRRLAPPSLRLPVENQLKKTKKDF